MFDEYKDPDTKVQTNYLMDNNEKIVVFEFRGVSIVYESLISTFSV